ncbi:MAG: transposase [Clostridiales bacterium]|nr:transposase [Clostridiales bacterium]
MCIVPTPGKISEGRLETRSGQLLFPMGIEACIPEDDMVRFFAREFENLDYSGLYKARNCLVGRSGPGRPPTDPKAIFQVCSFGYANDLYSTRKIEEACLKRIDFMWLLDGEPAPGHTTTSNFRPSECKEATGACSTSSPSIWREPARRATRLAWQAAPKSRASQAGTLSFGGGRWRKTWRNWLKRPPLHSSASGSGAKPQQAAWEAP